MLNINLLCDYQNFINRNVIYFISFFVIIQFSQSKMRNLPKQNWDFIFHLLMSRYKQLDKKDNVWRQPLIIMPHFKRSGGDHKMSQGKEESLSVETSHLKYHKICHALFVKSLKNPQNYVFLLKKYYKVPFEYPFELQQLEVKSYKILILLW